MYLPKVLKSKIYFLIISFLITLNANAELIKPNNGIEPYQVVKIQLRSLKKNDDLTYCIKGFSRMKLHLSHGDLR